MMEVFLETWSQGGIVLVPIFLAGFWGFFLVLQTYAEIGSGIWKVKLMPRLDEFKALAAAGRDDEARALATQFPPLMREGVILALDNRTLPEPALRHLLAEKLAFRLFRMERHIPLIKSLAGAAPLLGLLGTVSGLIHTFQVLNEYSSGSSQLLARGISEALIATQTGLLVAVAMILLGQRLEGRVTWLKRQVEYGMASLLNLFHSASGGRS